VNIPPDLAPDELTVARARELIEAPVQSDRELGVNPENGKLIVVKDGRFGPYVTEVEAEEAPVPDSVDITDAVDEVVDLETGEVRQAKKKPAKSSKAAKAEKPRTASLFKSMDPGTIDLDTALKLLGLPRTVGEDPESGEPILAQNGRYGAYLKKGADTRSLPSEDAIFDIDLPGALELFAQPKYGARRASSALKEFDADPVSGKPVRVKDGRFGPYVTDGETNATIPRGESVEEIDFARAVQLLADKRAKGPAKRPATGRRVSRTTAAKSTAKTTTAKSTSAKSTSTKSASAKSAAAKSAAAAKPTAGSAAKKAPAKTSARTTRAAKTSTRASAVSGAETSGAETSGAGS
jgi:DNA topoisomerase-1